MKKRLARIYPAYFICILLIVILFAPVAFTIIHNGNFDLTSYLNLNPSPVRFFIYALPLNLFENNIGPLLESINADNWNVSIWTLIFEFGCYIAVSVVMAILMKSRIRKNHYPVMLFVIYLILGIAYTLMPDSSSKVGIYFKLGLYLFSMFLQADLFIWLKTNLYFHINCLHSLWFIVRRAWHFFQETPPEYILLFQWHIFSLYFPLKLNLLDSLRKMTYPMGHISMRGQFNVLLQFLSLSITLTLLYGNT